MPKKFCWGETLPNKKIVNHMNERINTKHHMPFIYYRAGRSHVKPKTNPTGSITIK